MILFEGGRLLQKIIIQEGKVHLTLIDPASQTPERAAEIAFAADEGGTDAIMIGGSTSSFGILLDETVLKIKEKVDLPTILFPGNSAGLSRYADAVFFMSLLNSRDLGYVITNQVQGAPLVHKSQIEPISMAYLVVEPGGTVGWIGDQS